MDEKKRSHLEEIVNNIKDAEHLSAAPEPSSSALEKLASAPKQDDSAPEFSVLVQPNQSLSPPTKTGPSNKSFSVAEPYRDVEHMLSNLEGRDCSDSKARDGFGDLGETPVFQLENLENLQLVLPELGEPQIVIPETGELLTTNTYI